MQTLPKARSYRDAIKALNSLQTPFAVLEDRRRKGLKMSASAVTEMQQWLLRAGHQISELDRLNVVHVAGTKGKGTTCAFVNSILLRHKAEYGFPRKIGLYTSPHLLSVRDRIMINSEPISEEAFTRYFFEVWDALEGSTVQAGGEQNSMPNYFRFLTLMSFHIFLQEVVDVAIYEVGVGGAWDSTNIVERPAVTGITTLGIDHVAVLGDTIEKIAWHKAGIFKPQCPAFTVPQVPEASKVLQDRADEKQVTLETVKEFPAISRFKVVPDAEYQRQNASLALALASSVLEKLGYPSSLTRDPDTVAKDGIEQTVWRGRCEIKIDGHRRWYLDGAHTLDSLRVASQWFAQQCENDSMMRVLVFNQQSRPEATELLRSLHSTLQGRRITFDHVIFCTNVTRKETGYRIEFDNRNADADAIKDLKVQKAFAKTWADTRDPAKIHLASTIQEAVDLVEELSRDLQETKIFVTGSFHLIGGLLCLLEGIATPGSA